MEDYLSYSNLSHTYHSYIVAFSVAVEPSNFKEASLDQQWIDAMQAEVNALEQN